MPPIDPIRDGIRLRLHIQPRASSDQLAGVHGEAIKIRLTAPPIGGAANQALMALLAEVLEVPPSALRLTAGSSGRRKIVEAGGLTVEQARRRLGIGAAADG